MKNIFNILGLLFAVSVSAQTPANVFICAGQSNMVRGIGNSAPYTDDVTPADGAFDGFTGCHFWNNGSGAFVDAANYGTLRVSEAFAYHLREYNPTDDIYIIWYASSGKPLYHGVGSVSTGNFEDDHFRTSPNNYFPGMNADDKNIGSHYTNMITRAKDAQAALVAAGIDPTIDGIIWLQGEGDSKAEVPASSYDMSLVRFKERIAEDTNSEALNFVFGRVLPNDGVDDPMVTNPVKFTHRTNTHANMDKVGDNTPTNNFYISQAPANQMSGDLTHYTTAGYRTIGSSFADVVGATIMGLTKPTPPPAPTSPTALTDPGFDNPAKWTILGTGPVVSGSNATFANTAGGDGIQVVAENIATIAQSYTITLDYTATTGASGANLFLRVRKSSAGNTTRVGDQHKITLGSNLTNQTGTLSITVTLTEEDHNAYFFLGGTGASDSTVVFDNMTFAPTTP